MMFRGTSGTVSCTPYMRTSGGLVECSAVFYGQTGPVDVGSPPAMIVTASPEYVSGSKDSPSISSPVLTNPTTAGVSGGTPPYAYAWSVSNPAVSISNTSAATTNFRAFVGPGNSVEETATCVVTDSKGQTATSNSVTVVLENFNNSGGLA